MQRIATQSLSNLSCSFLSLQTFNSQFIPSSAVNNSLFLSSSASNFFILKRFSYKTNSSSESTNSVTPKNEEIEYHTQQGEDGDDVSREELKRRIEKFYEGDENEIPSIFEAILKRKLAGKHDHSDDELLEEFGSKPPTSKDYDSE